MSPRAAWRLEALGFSEVYDYVAGKVEWMAFGLPREGEAANRPTTGDAARRDAPVAGLDEPMAVVRARANGSGWDTCVVVNDEQVVLGRVGRSALSDSPDVALVAQVMAEGPSTVRPDKLLRDEVERMTKNDLASVVVTTPDGRLFGVLRRDEAERRA